MKAADSIPILAQKSLDPVAETATIVIVALPVLVPTRCVITIMICCHVNKIHIYFLTKKLLFNLALNLKMAAEIRRCIGVL